MMPKAETSGDDAAEEWSTPVNWEEDPAIKAKRRRRGERISYQLLCIRVFRPIDAFHLFNTTLPVR